MFTGLIEEVGVVQVVKSVSGGKEFTVQAPGVSSKLEIGDSIAGNGVCTTVTAQIKDSFEISAAPETLTKTNLSFWRTGTKVNLERPLKLGDSLDGHWVLGHVDGMAKVTAVQKAGSSVLLTVDLPEELIPYVVPQGSIALDGVSLTVARLEQRRITVSLVRYTLERTNLDDRKVGDKLNVETDILGKHIVQYLQSREKKGKVTLDLLREQGYIT
jgi:riboflavin synthase